MGTYPYPPAIRYPETRHEYLLEWNTRLVSSESWPTYRLNYERR
jgi:hypothetical protein